MSNEKENFNEKDETSKKIIQSKEFYYNCSECSSQIEIISMNETEIEFKCINNNHLKKISIKDYINKMKVFNNKNNKNDININHNNKFEGYCLDCKIHLCKEYLKSSNHINHNIKLITKLAPNKKELNIIENIIKYYEEKIENLEKEKLIKAKELDNKLKEYKNKLNKTRVLKITTNKINMEIEIKSKYNEYILNIKDLRNKYEDELKLIKYKYENDINTIQNKYKNMNENNSIIDKNQLENLYNKYSKLITKKNEIINNMNYIKTLNKTIYNNYINFSHNYHNLINIIFLINNYQKKLYNNLNEENEKIITKENDNFMDNKMLERIKSFYILKDIIFHLNSKKQMEIMKYNKKMQNKFEKNIIHYKLFSKKYIIYEKDRKGKEYNKNNILLFEGEYSNGKRNGKGKEYDYKNFKSYLIYEGEY